MKVDKRTKEYRKYNRPEDILKNAKARYKIMSQADKHNREDAVEDLRFNNLPGAQWSENMKQERGERPCYEYPKTRVRCKRVVNDMRDNRPSGKVRAVEGGDKDIAEIYEGLIRNIWNVSHGDNATDYAAEYAVECGMGAWRIVTDYSDDSAFDQDIMIEGIENPLCLYCDPSARDSMKRDAQDWIFTERITHTEHEELYGDADKIDFEADSDFEDDEDEWSDEETVRIAEYWYKVPTKKELWLVTMPDPESGEPKQIVVDSESDEAAAMTAQGFKPERTRTVDTHKIMMVVVNGQEVLEGPVEWAGRNFPWVMVHGEFKNIEGRDYWWGLVRHAKDAQRNLNISRTAIAETIAMAPKAKWWSTSTQAAGHTNEWAEADKKNFAWMLYEADPQAPGAPQRMGGADVPVALLQQQALDNEDLKDVMGLPDASMGHEGQEKSGRAIYARQQQGEIATFNYKDNMAKAVEYTMEILIDLIPEIYDTERELRILGVDGAENYKKVNQVVQDASTGKTLRINDLSMGKYDVTVTTGPAFSTQRQEAAETYMSLTQGDPTAMQIYGDLIYKSLDLPYADEIAERLKSMLPPQIQQMLNEDKEIPPEVQQMMQQAEMAMAEVQKHGQLVQAAAEELEGEKGEAEKVKADVEAAIANLRADKAELKAYFAEETAKLIEKGANLTVKSADVKVAAQEAGQVFEEATGAIAGRDALETVGRLDSVLAPFMQAADEAMGKFQAQTAQLEARTKRKPVGGQTRREGGRLTADIEFDDGSTESVSAVREKGGLRIVPPE